MVGIVQTGCGFLFLMCFSTPGALQGTKIQLLGLFGNSELEGISVHM